MAPMLQDRYVVLTGDLKSSKKLKDRAKVQEDKRGGKSLGIL